MTTGSRWRCWRAHRCARYHPTACPTRAPDGSYDDDHAGRALSSYQRVGPFPVLRSGGHGTDVEPLIAPGSVLVGPVFDGEARFEAHLLVFGDRRRSTTPTSTIGRISGCRTIRAASTAQLDHLRPSSSTRPTARPSSWSPPVPGQGGFVSHGLLYEPPRFEEDLGEVALTVHLVAAGRHGCRQRYRPGDGMEPTLSARRLRPSAGRGHCDRGTSRPLPLRRQRVVRGAPGRRLGGRGDQAYAGAARSSITWSSARRGYRAVLILEPQVRPVGISVAGGHRRAWGRGCASL